MGFVPFLKIIMLNQLKHKASSVGSILGVIIAIAFITGTFMTAEAIVSDLFTSELEELKVHFTANSWMDDQDINDNLEMMDDLLELEGVQDAGIIMQMYSDLHINYSYVNLVSGDEHGLELYFGQEMDLPAGENITLISKDLADNKELDIGDTYNLTMDVFHYRGEDPYFNGIKDDVEVIDPIGLDLPFEEGWYHVNMTMVVGGFIDDSKSPFDHSIYRGQGNMIVMYTELMSQIINISEGNGRWTSFSSSLYISIDPGFYTNIDDARGTQKETRLLKDDIEDVISERGFYIDWDRVSEVYEDYIYWSTTMRVFLVVMSLPLFLLCFYLVLVGSRIGMEAKVREISLLKVKGAGKGQVFSMLLVESITHGIIGALGGIFFGSLLSMVFIGQFLDNEVPFLSLLPGQFLTISLVMAACLIVILIRLRSIWRLSRMNILEAARGSPERKEKEYRPTIDIIVVTVIFLLIGIMTYFNENTPSGMGELVVNSVVETFKPILVLFLPFLLILSLSRLLILGIPATLTIVARPLQGMNKELHPLLLSTLRFGKRRIAIMAILISISLSFGILVLSQMETREATLEATIEASIPSDVYAVSSGSGWSMKENISSISGVHKVIDGRGYYIHGNMGSSGRSGDWFDSRGIGFDSQEYASSISKGENVLMEGRGPGSLLSDPQRNTVLINKAFSNDFDISLWDTLNISIEHQWPIGDMDHSYDWYELEETHVELQVIGIVDHMPGLRSEMDVDILEEMLYDYDSLGASSLEERPCIYFDISVMPEVIGSQTWIYLIETGDDPEKVRQGIDELTWKGDVVSTTTMKEELETVQDNPANRGMDLVLIVQFACVLVSVIVGLFLLQLVSNSGRKREFAEIMSRGATRENIFKLLLSEGLTVILIGLVIGTGVGLLVAYSFQTVFTGDWTESIGDFGSAVDLEHTISIDQGVIFPATILLIHISTIISMLVAVTIVSFLSTKIDISSNLRLRRS